MNRVSHTFSVLYVLVYRALEAATLLDQGKKVTENSKEGVLVPTPFQRLRDHK